MTETSVPTRDAALAQLRAEIGHAFGPSPWVTVTQATIDRFATLTHDEQFIHVDPERAAATDLGGTIAHGFLTLSLASSFAYACLEDLPGQKAALNYGFDTLRFLTPVRAGARIRGSFVLRDAVPRAADSILRTVTLTIETEGGECPALVADWLALLVFDRA